MVAVYGPEARVKRRRVHEDEPIPWHNHWTITDDRVLQARFYFNNFPQTASNPLPVYQDSLPPRLTFVFVHLRQIRTFNRSVGCKDLCWSLKRGNKHRISDQRREPIQVLFDFNRRLSNSPNRDLYMTWEALYHDKAPRLSSVGALLATL